MGDDTAGSRYRSGIVFGLVAYGCWGLIPLYFHAFRGYHVGAAELLAHRIVWSTVLLAGVTTVLGGWGDLFRALRSRRLVLTLAGSSALLGVNWLLYIHATVTGRVAEASLGYYMMPLVNAFLATAVLGEKLRPLHYPALSLVACGVAVPFVWQGDFTWLAVAIPVSFGCYGLVRKLAPVDSLAGLTVETLVLTVPSAAYLLAESAAGRGAFGPDPRLNALLAAGSVVTVVPLATFTVSIRRMPLLANSFLQFVSPTTQLLLAVFWIGEAVTPDRWAAMGLVWAAVGLFLLDAVLRLRPVRTPAVPVAKPRRPRPAVLEA